VEKLTLYALNRTLSASGARLLPPYAVTVLGSFVPYSPQAFSLVLSGPLITLSTELCGGVAPTPSAAPPSPAPPAAAPAAAPAPAPPSAGEVVGEIALALFLFALGAWVATCYHRRQCCFKGVAKAAPPQLPQHLYQQQHMHQQQHMQQQPTQQQQQQQQAKPSLELGGVATNPMMQATAWR
jgi:hypothetical protein